MTRQLPMLLLIGLLCGCHALPRTPVIRPPPPATAQGAIARGIEFLANTQVTPLEEHETGRNWAGNWPFVVRPDLAVGAIPVVELAVGLPVYIHTTLSVFHEGTQDALGISPREVALARRMRTRIWPFVERFRAAGSDPGEYGWWPQRQIRNRGFEVLLANMLDAQMRGPALHGDRALPNIPAFPPALALHSDTDETALVHAARLDDARLDGGPTPSNSIGPLFSPWRDVAGVPRRLPSWLECGSGAFLTWMMDPAPGRAGNDVDVVVNANILWALARYGELDTPGAADAIHLIDRATREGRQGCERQLSAWYPRLVTHFAVARAYAEGPVPELMGAVQVLVADLLQSARMRPDGSASWGLAGSAGEGHLTSLAILALVHGGYRGPLLDAGCRRLRQLQDPTTGGWPAATVCWGRADTGIRTIWITAALPTAFAIEALARVRLARAERGVSTPGGS